MMTLIAAALAAAAPAASTADPHAHQEAQHQMMDCCKEMKADCAECCKDMDGKRAGNGSKHEQRAHQ